MSLTQPFNEQVLCTELGAEEASGHHAVPCSAWTNALTCPVSRGVGGSPGTDPDGTAEGTPLSMLTTVGMASWGQTDA